EHAFDASSPNIGFIILVQLSYISKPAAQIILLKDFFPANRAPVLRPGVQSPGSQVGHTKSERKDIIDGFAEVESSSKTRRHARFHVTRHERMTEVHPELPHVFG